MGLLLNSAATYRSHPHSLSLATVFCCESIACSINRFSLYKIISIIFYSVFYSIFYSNSIYSIYSTLKMKTDSVTRPPPLHVPLSFCRTFVFYCFAVWKNGTPLWKRFYRLSKIFQWQFIFNNIYI